MFYLTECRTQGFLIEVTPDNRGIKINADISHPFKKERCPLIVPFYENFHDDINARAMS